MTIETAGSEVRTCVFCVMDDASDDSITFDELGQCNYCRDALERMKTTYFPDEVGEKELDRLLRMLKEEGKSHDYDCLMGLSGGLDSSYLAYLGAEKWDLRIAAVHIDDGFDTPISQENIRRLCERAGIELITLTPDPEQYNDLTLAYMKAGVPNLAAPQDNILFATLYDHAKRYGISHYLSGGNFALESILQQGNTWTAGDVVNIKDIHRRFGTKPIDKLHFLSNLRRNVSHRLLGIRTHRPLDLIDYNRDRAFQELHDYCGFEYYGAKHLENYLTAFAQLYWLPRKFGVDKRKSHLSSLIVSGQMTREEALLELERPMYSDAFMDEVLSVLSRSLGISLERIEELVAAPGHQHDEYRVDTLFQALFRILR